MQGIDDLNRASAESVLFGGSVIFAPIRHHSPACAWALRQMIREHRPELVLIEAPDDLGHHIPHLLDTEARFPLAIAAIGKAEDDELAQQDKRRPISYIPFSSHAPELVALQEAQHLGAKAIFIDLPVNARNLSMTDRPVALQSEFVFDSASFVTETCRRLGLRDGYELWDHLFESRLGQSDWRSFFTDVYTYCAALRASTREAELMADDTLIREAQMRAHLARIGQRRAVVVTGGFHTPALLVAAPKGALMTAKPSESYLIGYGEEALDALAGYAAGLRFPAWYAAIWAQANASGGAPDWATHGLNTLQGFAGAEARAGHRIAIPQLVESLAMAEGLARLRGRNATLLHDLIDGMRTALIKGEAHPKDRRTDAFFRHLRGTRLGVAPASAGLPPIVHDARSRASAVRIDLTDSLRRPRKLDFRRKESHARASRFFHQMQLLDTQFSALVSGPDPAGGARAGLLFEEWDIGWSPQVEGRLIEAARLGATIPEAAAASLAERRAALVAQGRGDDLAALLDLLIRAVQCGLAEHCRPLLATLEDVFTRTTDLTGLAEIIARLLAAPEPGAALHAPGIPDLSYLARLAYTRFLYLCDDLPQAPEEELGAHINALGRIAGCLRNEQNDRLDAPQFDLVLEKMADAIETPPLLRGAVMGLMTQAGFLEIAVMANTLHGNLRAVGYSVEQRAAMLDGLLRASPSLLWQSRTVLQAVEAVMAALDDVAFLEILPVLRHSLTKLNPHETSRLADGLAELFEVGATRLTATSRFSELDVMRAIRADTHLGKQLDAEGLSHWIKP